MLNKPYLSYVWIFAIFLIALTLAKIVLSNHSNFFITATGGYFIFLISTIPTFFVLKKIEGNEKLVFWWLYISCILIVPLLWLGIIYSMLSLYAMLIVQCCESNQYLQQDVWYALSSIHEELAPDLFNGFLAYTSTFLAINIKRTKILKIIASMLAVISLIFFAFMAISGFMQ